MAPAQAAWAHHHSYALLSRLFLEGLTAEIVPYLQQVEALAPLLPCPFDEDQAAAGHQQLFGFEIFPYEAIFLDESGLLGGALSNAITSSYRQAGYQVGSSSESADHVGHELGLLAWLAGAEAEALEDGLALVAQNLQARRQDFLQRHLLRWLPALVLAIGQEGVPFYTALADLTLQLCEEEVTTDVEAGANAASYRLPQPPQLLGEKDTGLKEIAGFLLTPPFSGLYLSHSSLARLARELGLPRGFGSRRQILVNALRSAAQYDMLPQLLAGLEQIVTQWERGYAELTRSGNAAFYTVWQQRVMQTRAVVQEMQERIRMADE